MTAGTETCVKVVVRCRPLLGHEDGALDVSKIDEAGGSIKIGDKTHKYGPGGAVGGTGRHDAMYDVTTKPLVAQLSPSQHEPRTRTKWRSSCKGGTTSFACIHRRTARSSRQTAPRFGMLSVRRECQL